MTPDVKWLRDLPVRSKFTIILVMIMLILVFGLINLWFSLKVMSAVRAYVGGEGLWSKAQKEAVNNLIKYSRSYDESDFNNYLEFLKVPLGDNQARLELNKDQPDFQIIREGFIQGGNHPEDVDDLIFLYRWFKDIGRMKIAIADWTQGDAEIANLSVVGEQIHQSIKGRGGLSESELTQKLNPLINEVYSIDKRLTFVENHFSSTLSEGSRRIREFLFFVTLFLTVFLGVTALLIAFYIGKVIEEVDKIKNEFVSMASHELRTPMAAIKGFVSMILMERYGKLDSRLKKPLENVSLSIERLIKLSNDLLDVSRIESSGLKPRITDCSTPDLIREVINNLQNIASQNGTTVKIEKLDEALVRADAGYVRQILNNLVGNAIKFSKQGNVIISSRVAGNRQLIYVSDSGMGIPKEEQPKIFLKFQQLTSEKSGRPQGSGLGLYISRKLARKMSGDLTLEKSESGTGSIFALALPLSTRKID